MTHLDQPSSKEGFIQNEGGFDMCWLGKFYIRISGYNLLDS